VHFYRDIPPTPRRFAAPQVDLFVGAITTGYPTTRPSDSASPAIVITRRSILQLRWRSASWCGIREGDESGGRSGEVSSGRRMPWRRYNILPAFNGNVRGTLWPC
jgi:hypothetical protein